MKISIKKIRRNNVYSVIANGEEYILKANWDRYTESVDIDITETATGNLWSVFNATDLSEYTEKEAEIAKAYINWSWENE